MTISRATKYRQVTTIICSGVTLEISLRTNSAGGGPIRRAHALEIHLKEPNGLLAGRDAVADFSPGSVLDDCRVANCHRPRGNFPNVAIGRARQHEIADVPLP